MRDTQTHNAVGRAIEARRLVGLERHYSCSGCGAQHRSWTRMRACPDCGERLAFAVIHRAALSAV